MTTKYRGGSMPGMNQALGLPFGEHMQKVALCFDVDGTLIDHLGNERERYTQFVTLMHKAFKNAKIVIWSGGGRDYAETRARELGIDHLAWAFMSKMQHQELRSAGYVILAFDDIQDARLGDINLIVRQ